MSWQVEITDIGLDKRLLTDVLRDLNVKLHQEDSTTYLVSDRFESLSTVSEIWMEAKRIHDAIAEVSDGTLGVERSFKLSNLYEQKEDGSRIRQQLVIMTIKPGNVIRISAKIEQSPTRENSEEDRAKLEAERQEHEYQERRALVSSRVLSIDRDERALKVYRILQQDLTPKLMYDIYDLIKDDLGEKI